MQKQIKTLIITCVALVLCIAAFFAIRTILDKVEETEEAHTQTLTIWSYDDHALQSVSVERNVNPYAISQVDGVLTVDGYEGLPRQDSFYGLLEAFSDLTAVRLIEGGNPESFGITTPTATLHFVFLDENNAEVSHEIKLGNTTDDGLQIYADVDDSIYAMSFTQFTSLLESPTAYLSKNLAPYSANPSTITFQTGAFTTEVGGTFTVGKTEIDNTNSFSSGYSILSPVLRPIAYTKVDELTQELLVLQGEVESIHPSEEDLVKYGLKQPSATMDVHYVIREDNKTIDDESLEKGSYTIHLGNYDAENRIYYAQAEGTAIIYRVLEEVVPWHDYTIYSLMSTNLLDASASEVKQIEVKDQTETVIFTLTGEDPREAIIGDVVVDEESFSLYYELLLRGKGIAFVPRESLENPLLTLTFTFEESLGKDSLVLTFYQGEGQNLIVHTSDPEVEMNLTISRSYAEKVISCTKLLSMGKTIDSIEW